jgi:hypothetical protein
MVRTIIYTEVAARLVRIAIAKHARQLMQTRAMYATMGLRQQVTRVLPQIVRRVRAGRARIMVALRVMETMVKDVARRAPVDMHGHTDGVGWTPGCMNPRGSFALQELWTLAVGMNMEAVARRVPVGTHGNPEGAMSEEWGGYTLVPNGYALQDLVIPAKAFRVAYRI